MKRTNTINFMQIENSLHDAIEVCTKQPEAPFAQSYGEKLRLTSAALAELTAHADRLYLVWREKMKQRLIAAKSLLRAFEEIRDEIGEYGYEPRPPGRYSYWDYELMREAVEVLIAFLDENAAREGEDGFIYEAAEWAGRLREHLARFDQSMRDEARGLQEYKRAAPLRRQAIYRAMRVVDDFAQVHHDYTR